MVKQKAIRSTTQKQGKQTDADLPNKTFKKRYGRSVSDPVSTRVTWLGTGAPKSTGIDKTKDLMRPLHCRIGRLA